MKKPPIYESRRSAPARGRGRPAPRRRPPPAPRYLTISQSEYEDAISGDVAEWGVSFEGPFRHEEDAREYVEAEFGVHAVVIDLGVDGARAVERLEAERQEWLAATRAGHDRGDWSDRETAVMVELLRRGTVLGRYDARTMRWGPYMRRVSTPLAESDGRPSLEKFERQHDASLDDARVWLAEELVYWYEDGMPSEFLPLWRPVLAAAGYSERPDHPQALRRAEHYIMDTATIEELDRWMTIRSRLYGFDDPDIGGRR